MIKEWCEKCESKGKICIDNDEYASYALRKCHYCQGKGYIEREIKAEDLSVEEQRRMIMAWTDFCETKTKDEPQSLEDWKGLKK